MSEMVLRTENENKKEKPNYFYWKGKKVSEKKYNVRCKQQQLAQNLNRHLKSFDSKYNLQKTLKDANNSGSVIEGRRIVNVNIFATEMICKHCKYKLHLSGIVKEKQYGVASVFYIRCERCRMICTVPTDTQHVTSNNQKHFDSNTKSAAGIIDAGIGNTDINKWLSAMNMPPLYWKTFKAHEQEVGICVEDMSEESCKKATLEEKRLTIENLNEIEKFLPLHLNLHFIFPNLPSDCDIKTIQKNILQSTLVRLFILFDFGWTTKGSGRSYDSLSGTGTVIGYFTGKVLSYINLNRKCKSCDLHISTDKHFCKKNFEGSAKSMEPYAASQFISNNTTFLECNVQIGIVGADNDSSAIKAMREASSHEIVKHSDKNHTSKGVVSELYRIKSSHKEVNGKEISYLKKCFNYSIAQCKNDCTAMTAALRNIPYHCYNIHNNCGTWCGYYKNPETYKHQVIGNGFQDQNLFDDLKCLFNTLANKVPEFAASISTNANESLNATIASYAPKSRMYGMSASGSQRTACAINKKNDGQRYSVDLNKNLTLSPGTHTLKHANRIDNFSKRRYEKQSTIDSKRRRLEKKKLRNELKIRKETLEGTTYETNIGLLHNFDLPAIIQVDKNAPFIVVLFDLETGGFQKTADILQIAAKYEDFEFSIYIKPAKVISADATLVNKLTYVNGYLQYKGENVIAFSLQEGLLALYEFLCQFKEKCILTAHNCNFDYPRLMRAIAAVSMRQHFKSIIAGFGDTLPLIRKVSGRKGKGSNKLENLANDLKINATDAHNAVCDLQILSQILLKFNITNINIIRSAISWSDTEKKEELVKNLPSARKELHPLSNCTSKVMIKRMISAKISYSMILREFQQNKYFGLTNLFGKDENGIVKVTNSKKVVMKIFDYLKKNSTA